MAATKSVKVPNYTEEQTAKMIEEYTANPSRDTVENLAKELGKTVKSVTAKLVRAGVYVSKEYVNKNGQKPVKKDDRADAIGLVLGLTEPEVTSLAKANKSALEKIFNALANSKPIDGNE